MREIQFEIPEAYQNKKLITFLRGKLGFSTHLVQMLRHTPGSVTVEGRVVRMIDPLHAGELLLVRIPETTTPPLQFESTLCILYEDADILVLNKPAGISVHPTRNHPNFTLANAVSAYLAKESGTPCAARAVGRLDKGTSGCMVFAKNLLAASSLSGTVEKIYNAVACCSWTGSGTIDAPIVRPDPKKTLRAVSTDGKGDRAVTHWTALETRGDKTLLEVRIETGRTHQIRVHMASVGAPLLGDEMYGGRVTASLTRPALHCRDCFLRQPVTGEPLHFCAPLPADILAGFSEPCTQNDNR